MISLIRCLLDPALMISSWRYFKSSELPNVVMVCNLLNKIVSLAYCLFIMFLPLMGLMY
jgi:hypothetical protein